MRVELLLGISNMKQQIDEANKGRAAYVNNVSFSTQGVVYAEEERAGILKEAYEDDTTKNIYRGVEKGMESFYGKLTKRIPMNKISRSSNKKKIVKNYKSIKRVKSFDEVLVRYGDKDDQIMR
ncbi:hypothetical protein Tco_1524068 [Tanacetum coccineum]